MPQDTDESRRKDVWALALQERQQQQHGSEEERTVILVGSKQGGKTTLLMRFLDRPRDKPKPTTALEYTFGRRSRGHDLGKDIVHLWELAGGTSLASLIDTPISAATIRNSSVVLCLDLSKPNELWNTQERLLKALRNRVEKVLSDLTAKDSRLPQHLRKKAWHKFGDNHPDKDLLDPFPVPLLFVGTKYDVFQDMEPEKRKVVCRTLRFIAHCNGASLLFTSDQDDGLMSKCRALLSHFAFKTSAPSRSGSYDHTQPLIVPVGSDSLNGIGAPPVPTEDIGSVSARNPVDLWKAAYGSFFPPTKAETQAIPDDPASNAQFAEPDVDAMRTQKDEELERYRRQADRRARELAAKHAAGSDRRSRRSDKSGSSESSSRRKSSRPSKKPPA